VLLAGAVVAPASGSVGLATGATHATLAVDSAGDVQVTWSQGGAKESVIVSAAGKLTHGGSLAGPDVSKPTHVAGVPASLTVRNTAGGNLWALQQISNDAGKPPSLDLSHWSGAATSLTLSSDGTHLTGTVTFGGKPVTGTSVTPYGLHPRIYVYLDCFACGGKPGWSPMLGVAPRTDGSFSVLLRPTWTGSQYRATVMGPNAGTTYAPDAQVMISG
jgi:hypothetical protein